MFCRMSQAVDEGIASISMRLQEINLFDDTIIIVFTMDNGG